MKMTILGLLAMMISTSTMASANDFENLTGEYEVTYETGLIFKKEKSFTIRYFEPVKGKPGDLLFESEELGACDNVNNLGGRADYGYVIYNTDDGLTKLDDVDTFSYVQSTIFCDSGWYQLAIETERFALENAEVGEKVKAGLFLKNSDSETLLNKAATIKRLR
jgi:hypothetical protein